LTLRALLASLRYLCWHCCCIVVGIVACVCIVAVV
jgi:hypothetical protein